MQSHFELFGLPARFALEKDVLDKAYREIQSQVHPDRFANAGAAERRASLEQATRVNDAYRALKDPVQRASHLLALHGVDVAFETNTQMPSAFLLQQLDLREELEAAVRRKDVAGLDNIRLRLSQEAKALQAEIENLVDVRQDHSAAAEPVRKLMFLDRLGAEVDAAYGDLE